ncbi:MAG: enoyl-CoA hydratase-related protein [Actinomycetota bacterium]
MTLHRERSGKVEILRLDRPEARNAIDPDTSRSIEAALDEVEADPGVWCVVVTGTGPVFCAGADLKVIAAGQGGEIITARGGFAGITSRELRVPLIAAVNGAALAGGFEIVLACDLVVAADTAVFGLPEVQRGLLAAAGGPVRLAQRVPLAVALELAMLGDPVPAARAAELGLVTRVVPADRVLDEALALADRIVANSPAAVRGARRLVLGAADTDRAGGWALNRDVLREVAASPDGIEGARAFVEKRAPVWADPGPPRVNPGSEHS